MRYPLFLICNFFIFILFDLASIAQINGVLKEKLDSVIIDDIDSDYTDIETYRYIYDQNNRPIKRIPTNWRLSSKEFHYSGMIDYGYNSDGLIESRTIYDYYSSYEGPKKDYRYKIQYSYDLDKKLMESIGLGCSFSNWDYHMKISCQIKDNQFSYSLFKIKGDNWSNERDSIIYFFNGAKKDSVWTFSLPNNETLKPNIREIYSYDLKNMRGIALEYHGGSLYSKIEFSFNSEYYLTEYNVFRIIGGAKKPVSKLSREFDRYGNLLLEIDSSFSTSKSKWEFKRRIQYSYNYDTPLNEVSYNEQEYLINLATDAHVFKDGEGFFFPKLDFMQISFKNKVTDIIVNSGYISEHIHFYYSNFHNTAKPTLSLSAASLDITASENNSGSFNIISNISWNINSDQVWLKVNKDSGSENGVISFTASANTMAEPRTAIITVSGSGVTSKTIIVTQAAALAILSVSTTTLNIGASANSTGTFDITSNTSWNIICDQSWLTLNNVSGTKNASVKATVSANPGVNQRKATITVSGNGIDSKTIAVTQALGITGIIKDENPYIKIYPIPVEEKLLVDLVSGQIFSEIKLLTTKGIEVFSSKSIRDMNEVDMSNYSTGLYFVKLIAADGSSFIKKILKQ